MGMITPLIVVGIICWYIIRIQVTLEMNTAMKQYSPEYTRRKRFTLAFFFGWIWPITIAALVISQSVIMDRNPKQSGGGQQ